MKASRLAERSPREERAAERRAALISLTFTRRTLSTERAPLAGTCPLLRAALINRITNVEKKTRARPAKLPSAPANTRTCTRYPKKDKLSVHVSHA